MFNYLWCTVQTWRQKCTVVGYVNVVSRCNEGIGWWCRRNVKYKEKGKVQTRTGHEGPERELRYSSSLSLTSALDGLGGQRHDPAALLPGDPVPIYRRLGGAQSRCRSGRVWRISLLAGFRSLDHPVRSESLYRLSYPGVDGIHVLVEGKLIPIEFWISPEGSGSFETSWRKRVGTWIHITWHELCVYFYRRFWISRTY